MVSRCFWVLEPLLKGGCGSVLDMRRFVTKDSKCRDAYHSCMHIVYKLFEWKSGCISAIKDVDLLCYDKQTVSGVVITTSP